MHLYPCLLQFKLYLESLYNRISIYPTNYLISIKSIMIISLRVQDFHYVHKHCNLKPKCWKLLVFSLLFMIVLLLLKKAIKLCSGALNSKIKVILMHICKLKCLVNLQLYYLEDNESFSHI